MQSSRSALHCHLSPVRLYRIFPNYLINGKIFGKNLLRLKCVLCLSLLFSETLVILRGNEREMIKKTCVGLYVRCRYSCQILMTLEFSRDIFVKILNIRFLEYPSSGSCVVPCERPDGQMDRRNEANIRFSQFCKPTRQTIRSDFYGTFALCSEAHNKTRWCNMNTTYNLWMWHLVKPKVSARLKKFTLVCEISIETSKNYLLKSFPCRKGFGYLFI